jgi:hypothetical protein
MASVTAGKSIDPFIPISQAIDAMNNKLKTIAKNTENNIQILYFKQDNNVDTNRAGHDFKMAVQASKPVIFTVAVDSRATGADGYAFVFLPRMTQPNIGIMDIRATSEPNHRTATFPGTLMEISGHNTMMGYSVLVQGSIGTTITVSDNPFYP